jgi:hypothetical protein
VPLFRCFCPSPATLQPITWKLMCEEEKRNGKILGNNFGGGFRVKVVGEPGTGSDVSESHWTENVGDKVSCACALPSFIFFTYLLKP